MVGNSVNLMARIAASVAFIAVFANVSAKEPPLGADEGLPRAAWQDAKSLIGKTALIHGRVSSVGHTERVHFLNFSKQRSDFKVVIFSDSIKSFDHPLENYVGKLIQVRGRVSLYNKNPQIVVGTSRQIKSIERAPAPWVPLIPRIKLGPELTIATFNAENMFDAADDPYRNDESTPSKNRVDLEKLAATIRDIDADVLALQEIESRGYLERFNRVLLPDLGYRHIVHYEGNDGRGIDVSLLSRLPIGAVTSYRHLRFKDAQGNSRRFQRDVLRVEVQPAHGEMFEIWVVHLKSSYGGRAAAEPIRLAECHKLREILDDVLRKSPDRGILVCGDFNDTIDSAAVKTIRGAVGSKFHLDCFVNDVKNRAAVTYNKPPYESIIDFIMTSRGMSRRYVVGSYQIRNGLHTQTGSDHNPVFARFRVR